jgi:hypothetical protein
LFAVRRAETLGGIQFAKSSGFCSKWVLTFSINTTFFRTGGVICFLKITSIFIWIEPTAQYFTARFTKIGYKNILAVYICCGQ